MMMMMMMMMMNLRHVNDNYIHTHNYTLLFSLSVSRCLFFFSRLTDDVKA